MRKPKLIYYNDARHYSLYRYDPPMSEHQLRQPVDEILGTGVDTIAFLSLIHISEPTRPY